MTDNRQMLANAASSKPPVSGTRALLLLTALAGAIVVSPLIVMGKVQPWLAVLGLVMLLPYIVVGWRLLRTPQAKEGPGLAFGIALMFVPSGLLLLSSVIGEHPDYRRLTYFSALVLVHLLLIGFALPAFRSGTSDKPAWRVLLRSILDPAVYFAIVLLLAAGAHFHR